MSGSTVAAATPACRVCGSAAGHRSFAAHDTMFGGDATYPYFECGACGCVQIAGLPASPGAAYPRDYYSFRPFREPAWRRFLKERRAAHALGRRNPIGALLAWRTGAPAFVAWVRRVGLEPDDPVLDVGCGAGQLLYDLALGGFRNAVGIDPFSPPDAAYPPGVRVERRHLDDVADRYALVIWNHSFEHVEDPADSLRATRRALRGDGAVLIRTPVAGRFAWRTFGPNWVQLDAPRHLHVHTERSLRLLAERTGFDVADVLWDSTAFQFWGSEQAARGIALEDRRSYAKDPRRSIFRREEIRAYEREAVRLNARGDGDQATFILRPARGGG